VVRYLAIFGVLALALVLVVEIFFSREIQSNDSIFDTQNIAQKIDSFSSNALIMVFRDFYQKVLSSYAGVENCAISVNWFERKLVFNVKFYDPVYLAFFRTNFYSVDPLGRKSLAQAKQEQKPEKQLVYVNDHLTYETIESSFIDFILKTRRMGFHLCYAAISESLASIKFCGFPVLRIYFIDESSFNNLASMAASKLMLKLDKLSKYSVEEITLNFDQSLTVSFNANNHNN